MIFWNLYFSQNLPKPEYTKKGREKAPRKNDIVTAVRAVIRKYPELLDYYIRFKEDHGDRAQSVSEKKVEEVYNLFVSDLSKFIISLAKETDFYTKKGDTLSKLAKKYDVEESEILDVFISEMREQNIPIIVEVRENNIVIPVDEIGKKVWTRKLSLAKAAADLIRDHNRIVIDSGSTTGALIEQLNSKRGLVVMTNSLHVANALNELESEAALVGAGGRWGTR